MKIRSFLAIEIPNKIYDSIVECRNNILFDEKLRWEKKNNSHITLKFFGEIEESQIVKISEILDEVAKNTKAFAISFSDFGFFRKDEKPKILFLGLNRNDDLKKLFNILEMKFDKIGIQKEQRNFNPHLTLLRVRTQNNSLKIFENKSIGNLSFICKSFSLMKSELKKSGSIYTRISKYYFKEA